MIPKPTSTNIDPNPAIPSRVLFLSTRPKMDCSITNAPARKNGSPKTMRQPGPPEFCLEAEWFVTFRMPA